MRTGWLGPGDIYMGGARGRKQQTEGAMSTTEAGLNEPAYTVFDNAGNLN